MNSHAVGPTAAIIAEYNPLHNGHAYHIARTRVLTGAEHVLVIMSGNFVQRGDCAVIDKFTRTRMALAGGADLVLELPLPFACAGAEKFASGGVGIADALGCVDFLSFGMECDDVQGLAKAARAVSDEAIKPTLDRLLAEGKPFAAARTEAVREVYGDETAALLCLPNNTLGVEYLRALDRAQSAIRPVGIPRQGTGHHSLHASGEFASATALRRMLADGDLSAAAPYLPQAVRELLRERIAEGTAPASLRYCERAVLARLRGMTKEQLLRLPDISEGLENRIYDSIRSACSLEELYASVKTKRYSHARIRRIVLSAFLGLRAVHGESLPYIRILGMNERGRRLLSFAKPTLPIISSHKHVAGLPQEAQNVYRLECYADDMWALMTPTVQPCGADMTAKMIVK